MPVTRRALSVVNLSLAAVSGLFGLAIAMLNLNRGIWIDEFITLTWTSPGTSLREFLFLMTTRDFHPILHHGLIYLAQAAGIADIALLRFFNFLGVPLVFPLLLTVFEKNRSASRKPSSFQFFHVVTVFQYFFPELRPYFLLYSASIATSVLWYTLMRKIEEGRRLSGKVIALWGACLAVFVNLHYFATIFGGLLTLTLLIGLAVRRLWIPMCAIAGVSMLAATLALVLGAMQVFLTPKGLMSWIKKGFVESLQSIVLMLEMVTALNLVVVGVAVASCVFIFRNRKKWGEFRIAAILLGVVGLFLGALIIANLFTPIIMARYLLAAGGAVTVAMAVLAANSAAPAWIPTAVGAFALLVQMQTFLWADHVGDGGWLPSAKAVAQLQSECPTTRIFAYPAYNRTNGLDDLALGLKINRVSYGYYAKELRFTYEDLLPGSTVVVEAFCPSVIWIENMSFFRDRANFDVDFILRELKISVKGEVELKRYGLGILMIVRERSNS